MRVSPTQIVRLFPRCPLALAEALADAMPAARIETVARIAAFLAQVGHESAGFSRLAENLNYSAEGLARTWPNRYAEPGGAPNVLALQLARQPEAIANNCYADRMGNGDEASGDGWAFRGRGLLQVTGRANYAAAGRALRLPLEDRPELLEQPGPAAQSAAWYWQAHDCNELADVDRFLAITRKINGGTHGHGGRVALRERVLRALRS